MKIYEILVNINSDSKRLDYKPLMTGFETIDNLVQGWKPGELCVIASRPAIGKTALILSLVRNIVNRKIPVALFTATDSENPSFISRVAHNLLDLKIKDKENDPLRFLTQVDLSDKAFYLYSNHEMTIDLICYHAKEMVEKNGVKCIFIETAQRIFFNSNSYLEDKLMEKDILALKKLAHELNIPIVISSDLSIAVECREGLDGKTPVLSDLSYCSAIENVSDSVWLLHRPSSYGLMMDENGDDLSNVAFIKIAKNRYGRTGKICLIFNEEKCSIEDSHSEQNLMLGENNRDLS